MFHPATSVLELRVDATLPVFPHGCTVDLSHNDTLTPCCAAVGSAPSLVDGVYGCPYNAAFAPAANQSFGACALEHGAGSICAAGSQNNAGLRLRWNSVAGAVLLAGVVYALVA
ncbi:hypothetical protein B0H17DRAFT_1204622 [Mycena rosella]|uniref:Uncharacterized protein n=1 Tax=Mycena rosella TaxID=1033263 RepID=A0AAD7GF08_MYCRO|nr:hypothetical protein B0H17DRAFT_1204622 [Mycena rosella]